ncbi:MAG: hypothetical protein BroJett011_62750 [Chloroflexota bacterium]|nr:MAG: hypothetical protein BroJett011_62750 [Chloroflexota bacterium]
MQKKLLLLLAALAIIALAGFGPLMQGTQRFREIITQNLTVQNGATFQGAATFSGAATHTGATTLDDVTLTGNIANRALYLRYQDVAAAPSIYAEAEVVSTTTSITTSILGIGTPRNVVLTYVTVTTATAGSVTVTGTDARGNSATELIAVAAVSGTQTLTGVVPWQSITSLAMPTRTEAVTLTIIGGQKFGLPIIPIAAGDVYHLTVNATPQAAPTVNATYGTFDPVSTPAADVDYNVWMKQ